MNIFFSYCLLFLPKKRQKSKESKISCPLVKNELIYFQNFKGFSAGRFGIFKIKRLKNLFVIIVPKDIEMLSTKMLFN